MAQIRIYKDSNARAIFIVQGIVGSYPLNCLKAISNIDTNTVSVQNLAKKYPNDDDFFEISNISYDLYTDLNGATYGSSATEVANALNAIFSETGSPISTNIPVITSSLGISASDGEPINYFLTADYGVGFEWDNIPSGLGIAQENERNLIGSIQDGVGTYNLTMIACNYYGVTSATLVIDVSSSFSNTKSIRFNRNDYLNGVAETDNPLHRSGNGSGASDAWTLVLWFKPGTSTNSAQTILYYGGTVPSTEGHVRLQYNGTDNNLKFRYGTNFNNLELDTPDNSITNGWYHIAITYDGGETGSGSASVNDYYSRFEIRIDNVIQSTTNSHVNYGYSNDISDDVFRIGKLSSSSSTLRNNCNVEELALWNSDQTSNLSTIYNSGIVHNLANLGEPPYHYWRMGDGDSYPNILDNISNADFEMINMTAADIVNDVP